jgi:hypothetical protein
LLLLLLLLLLKDRPAAASSTTMTRPTAGGRCNLTLSNANVHHPHNGAACVADRSTATPPPWSLLLACLFVAVGRSSAS